MRTHRTILLAASLVALTALVASGCGRVNDSSAPPTAPDADSTPQTDGTPAESPVDTGVRPDGCPTSYFVLACSASELGKTCIYDLCKSPSWQILKRECVKNMVPDPPYPYAWGAENLPCPKDAGTE
jgi:hypothetical protein